MASAYHTLGRAAISRRGRSRLEWHKEVAGTQMREYVGIRRSEGPVEIVCLGSAMVDFIGVEPSNTLGASETFKRAPGGATLNVAGTAARLGRTAAVVARVGMDAFGHYYRTQLGSLGVRDDWLQSDPRAPTTVAFYARQGTPRDVLMVRGADSRVELDEPARALIDGAAALHVTSFALTMEPLRAATVEAVERAHRAGRVVSFDPNFRTRNWPEGAIFMPLLQQLLPLTTVIKPSLSDAEAIWGAGLSPGEYIEQFHLHGARHVLLTLGREGVLISDGNSVQRLPTVPLDVVEAVGAGDAFTAGALAALVDGHSLVTAARVGMLVSGYKLRSPNYTGPLPRWATLLEQVRAQNETALPRRAATFP